MWSRIRSVHRGANLGAFEASGENSLVGRAALPAAPATSPSSVQSELSLVRALLSGDVAAASSFLDRTSATLWSVVVRLEGDGADGEAAFLHVVASLKANGYARLKGFDGRARLPTYLSFVVRDVLADRLAQRFSEAPRDAWRRFERFFERDIRRRVAQQLPRNVGINAREDAYQEVCLKLIENDYRRIRAYGGRGSFAGYVLTVVDRILIDLVRRELPRRRLPAAVARSSPLDQAIYVAIAWEACPLDAERLSVALRGRLESDPSTGDIREAMVRVAGLARLDGATPPRPAEAISLDGMVEEGGGLALADSAPTPEDYLLLAEEERSRAALVAAVAAAAAALPTEERLYLETVFSASEPLPAREIAKLMGYPVEEVYRLKQRTQRWLKEVAARLDKDTSRSV